MQATQLQLDFKAKKSPTLADIKYGEAFRLRTAEAGVFIKLRPVGQLLNSSLLSDVIGRGDCLVGNTATGTIKIASAKLAIIPVDATVMWEDK